MAEERVQFLCKHEECRKNGTLHDVAGEGRFFLARAILLDEWPLTFRCPEHEGYETLYWEGDILLPE